jgi:hypothetical protein
MIVHRLMGQSNLYFVLCSKPRHISLTQQEQYARMEMIVA